MKVQAWLVPVRARDRATVPVSRLLGVGMLGAALLGAPAVVGEAMGWSLTAFSLALVFGLEASVFGIGIGLLGTILRPASGARVFLPSTGALLASAVLLFAASRARMLAFARCGERAAPVIAAIDAFTRDHGAPPKLLGELVPQYLPAVPTTGLKRYPWFCDELDGSRGLGAAYELRIYCPQYPLGFDSFVYWPGGGYPERIDGGKVERLGAWAYVHD